LEEFPNICGPANQAVGVLKRSIGEPGQNPNREDTQESPTKLEKYKEVK
jgi:hypothetical protein